MRNCNPVRSTNPFMPNVCSPGFRAGLRTGALHGVFRLKAGLRTGALHGAFRLKAGLRTVVNQSLVVCTPVCSTGFSRNTQHKPHLAHELILSLDDPADLDLSPAQESEIQRRLKMVREGTATGRAKAVVFADIRSSYS